MVLLHEVPAERIRVRTGWRDHHGWFDTLTTNGNGALGTEMGLSEREWGSLVRPERVEGPATVRIRKPLLGRALAALGSSWVLF